MGTGWNSPTIFKKTVIIITDWDMGTGWNFAAKAAEAIRL